MLSFIINIKALNKIQFGFERALITKVLYLVIKEGTAFHRHTDKNKLRHNSNCFMDAFGRNY